MSMGVSVVVAVLFARVCVAQADVPVTNGTTSVDLVPRLKSLGLADRLDAISRIGALHDADSKRILVQHFQTIPRSEPTTNNRQTEKMAVARELEKQMTAAEYKGFALSTLQSELVALREAVKTDQGNSYPRDLIHLAFGALAKHIDSNDVLAEMKAIGGDSSLTEDVRVSAIAQTMKSVATTTSGVKMLVGGLELPPVAPIPWDIYTNAAKRVEYGKTDAMKGRRKEVSVWFKSSVGMENMAREQVLSSLGVPGVTSLLEVIELDASHTPKKDYFAMLAASILRDCIEKGNVPSEHAKKILLRLRVYFDTMQDEGAFGRRAKMAVDLNKCYSQLGLREEVSAKSDDVALKPRSMP